MATQNTRSFALGLTLLLAGSMLPVQAATGQDPARLAPLTAADEKHGHDILGDFDFRYRPDFAHPRFEEVSDIVTRLTKALGAGDEAWQITIYREPETTNVVAFRGNSVLLWSGLFDYAQDEEQLAALIAHELAHVVLGDIQTDSSHWFKNLFFTNEQIAEGVIDRCLQGDPAAGEKRDRLVIDLRMAYESKLILRPFSPEEEAAAAHLSYDILARAGFNPQAAAQYWTTLPNSPSRKGAGLFFCLHPAPAASPSHPAFRTGAEETRQDRTANPDR